MCLVLMCVYMSYTGMFQECAYKQDAPMSKMASVSFPSLAQALAVPWTDLVKRHFPLSDTFVRSRVLHKFRCVTG